MRMIKGKRKGNLTECHGGGERREEAGLPIQVIGFEVLGFLSGIFPPPGLCCAPSLTDSFFYLSPSLGF
jgi:hypothetical protein